MKTKQGKQYGSELTASEIARDIRNNSTITDILKSHSEEHRQQRFGGAIPTYVTAKDGEEMDKSGLPLLLMSLANYKITFHPASVTPHIAFQQLLKEMFRHVDDKAKLHWTEAMKKPHIALVLSARKLQMTLAKNAGEEDFF